MTVYEDLMSKDIDELADLIDKYTSIDDAPYILWWDENYCNKCESVIALFNNRQEEFAWCELNNKCKFFPEMGDVPDCIQIIKWWLESEI